MNEENPIRSKIKDWKQDQLQVAMVTYDKSNNNVSKVINSLKNYPAESFVYSKQSDFQLEKSPLIRLQLEMTKEVSRIFTYYNTIWNSDNWKILEKNIKGKTQYSVVKYNIKQVRSDQFFWRINNIFKRTGNFLNNSLHFLLLDNLWKGKLGKNLNILK